MQNDKAHIEAKAKANFLALYLGQDVYANTERDLMTYVTTDYIQDAIKGRRDGDYLLLRTVKQLTDDEWLQIGDVRGWKTVDKSHINTQRTIISSVQRDFRIGNPIVCDVMRSIGILLPFTTLISGEVKTYEVVEILANGWAKIKEEK